MPMSAIASYMKLFVALLLVVGGYYLALCQMTDMTMGQLTAITRQYESAAATADNWQTGDTSASFVGR